MVQTLRINQWRKTGSKIKQENFETENRKRAWTIF